ncbi:glycosyltransferase [Aeromonas sanarellii]|uniref:glycosyltransferase n=1 Tax=Aeromonas sanarellii TaxID=633415 RepID=UPI0038D04A51
MRKNITLFIDTFGTGGAERVCITYANILFGLGFNVSIMVFNQRMQSYLDELDAGIKIVNLSSKNGMFAFFTLLSCPRLIKDTDVFIAFNHQISLILYILTRVIFIKKTIIARNVNNLKLDLNAKKGNILKRHITKFLMRFFYNKMDGYIAQCNMMKQSMSDSYSIALDKIEVIYNPIAPKFRKIELCKDIDILFVGRLTQQKGIDNLIEILKRMKSTISSFNVHIVGAGELQSLLLNELDEYGIKYTYEYKCNDMVTLYNRARVTILTSYYEGYPNVLVESIACGTPVVSFDCESGPSEIIDNEKNGFLIPRFDLDIFTSKVAYILRSDFQINAELVNNDHKDRLINVINSSCY